LLAIVIIIKLTDSINHMIYNSLMPAKNRILLVMSHCCTPIDLYKYIQLNILLLFKAEL